MKTGLTAKTKILFISGSLGIGGAERLVSTLLQYLDRDRFEPVLCLFEDRFDYLLPDDIHTEIIGNGPGNIPRLILGLHRVIVKQKPQMVFSNCALPNRITSAALKGIQPKPYWVARIGNHPLRDGRTKLHHLVNYLWNVYAYRKTDHLIVNSDRLKKAIAKIHPNTKNRITALYNPTDFDYVEARARLKPSYRKDPKRLLLITVGRLHPQKRHDLLIRAVKRVSEMFPIDCFICGDGCLRRFLEKQIRRYGIQDRIKLLGYCDNPYSLMRQSDLFVLTSDWEGMPNVLIEAMSLGIPVVSTDCSFGPKELIENGKTGLLAKTGDTENIADCILKMLSMSDRIKMGQQGAAKVRHMFDQKKLMGRWHQFFEDVVGRSEVNLSG